MGFNLTRGLAVKFSGSSRSITQKIAITVILINLIGLGVTAFVISQMSGASQMEMAERNWLKDTTQIGAQAAGGVKWGKTEAIRSAYEIFQDDPKFALIGFTAFNQAGDQVDVWTRSETPYASLTQVLNSNPGEMSEATFEENAETVVVSAPLPAGKDGVSLGQIKTVWSTADIAMSAREFALKAMLSQIVVLVIAVTILLVAMRKFVGRPLADVNRRIGELQAGDIAAPIPHADKGDEIGVVARALTEFCNAAQMKLDADAEMVRQREQLDAERQANMSEAERSSQTQRKVVEELGAALEKLASGDLTARVPDLGGEFAALQDNFNRALSALEETVGTIDSAQHAVKQASDSLGTSTDELARRTEQQAAALEQTAAALDEITSTVKGSSEQAIEAGDLVGSTRDAATSSSEIVRSAITAMDGIEESSSRIAQILKVIDDIAFQTNLLALNAGVEAARAGEAGKGFAVVAQEVRDLAGRSANAAKQIKDLIEESGTQVSNGVDLVNRTGQSIEQIEKQIVEVAQKIDAISRASREQSTGLSQVNMAINEMDTMTQKNAAMVQDSNVSSQKLAGECQRLADVVTSFRLTAPASHAGTTEASRSAPSAVTRDSAPSASVPAAPVPRAAAEPHYQTQGNAALAQSTDNWEEF